MTNRYVVGGVLAVLTGVIVAVILLLAIIRPPITGIPRQPAPAVPSQQQPVSLYSAKAPATRNWRLKNFGHPHRVPRTRIDHIGRAVRIHNPCRCYRRQPMSNVYPIATGSFQGLSPRPCAGPLSGVRVPGQNRYQEDLGDQRIINLSEQTMPSFASRLPVSISSTRCVVLAVI